MDKSVPYTAQQQRLALLAKALAHPARIAILQFLAARSECYFGTIHEELPMAKATVSQHLKLLREAGLIQGAIEGPKVRYCLSPMGCQAAGKAFHALFTRLETSPQCHCE
jgi:hypothetical protein